MSPIPCARAFAAVSVLLLASGCALTPSGYRAERASLRQAAADFRDAALAEELPVQQHADDWRSLVRRALLANGDVRAAWFEWKAALERVKGASAWPNTNVALGYSYMFSDEKVKTFDRMSFSAGFDSMENLSFPGKAMAAGRVALADARASAERFRAAKFAVQRKVIDAWLDLALAAENARIQASAATLAEAGAGISEASLRTGGGQAESFSARAEAARRRNGSESSDSMVAQAKIGLAALTATERPGQILTPTRVPTPRELPADATVLVEAALEGPDVRGLEADRNAREEEERLAQLQWIPDINPTALFTGSIEQGVGAMIVLPSVFAEIRSGIDTAKAMRGAAAHKLDQARRGKRGEVERALVEARNAERARRLLEDGVLAAADSAAAAATSAYTTGGGTLTDVVVARSMLLETRSEIAAAAVEREKKLAEVEEILGADLETFLPERSANTARDEVVR